MASRIAERIEDLTAALAELVRSRVAAGGVEQLGRGERS